MSFTFYSNKAARPIDRAYVSTDKQGRIYISKRALSIMNVDTPVKLYVAYDKASRRIGLTEKPVIGCKPYNFNGNRAYASAKTFLRDLKILPEPYEDAHRYFFDEEEDGLYTFKFSSSDEIFAPAADVPDGQTSIDDFENEVPAAEPVVEVDSVDASALSKRDQELYYFRVKNPDLTHKEIGELFGMKKNTVTKALTRISDRLGVKL